VTKRAEGLLGEPRPGAPRQISDAAVERVLRLTLETTPKDATHWSTRGMAKRCGLSASRWIASVARPGGNLTGLFLDQPEMSAKLLQLLKDRVPGLTKVAILWDEVVAQAQFDATARAARASGLPILSLRVRRADDLGGAFDAAVREHADGLVVLTSPLFTQSRMRIAIVELALRHRLPGITLFTTFPAFGLLMAYGPDQPDAYRRAGSHYVARIFQGARPAD
jgi:putative ABC transport system substrate-binding protein